MKRLSILYLLLILVSLVAAGTCYANDSSIDWTEEEKTFIEEHPVINLGVDPLFAPFEFINEEGEHDGIAADYLALISERTGLKFNVRKGLSWPEAYNLALAGHIDALPAIGKTPEREGHFLFSEPYYFFKRVIVTKDTDDHILGIDDLSGLSVAVQQNSSHHGYMQEHEQLNLNLYDSVEGALAAVSTGAEIAFIGNLATTNYLIRSQGFTNLRFVAFEAEKQQALYFAVRSDWPVLVDIFNKAAGTITDKEKNEINSKWIDLETHLDLGPFFRIVKIVASIFGIVFAVSLFWIVRLHREIARRKRIQAELEMANYEIDMVNAGLQEANRELEKMSMVDGLTGISNRRYFDSFLKRLWGINMRGRFPVALVMVDIDHFKNYNDSYGHLAGDQCLKAVARIIDGTVRSPGDFVARYGGEEFVVLLSNTTEGGAAQLAERIRGKVEKTSIDNGVAETFVTISLGVAAMITTEGKKPEDLIRIADIALYKAKDDGRNRVVRASDVPDDYGA
ncbi:MAG TPA: diguanylate cyclase [Clostridia bacterium]|nr:diguanylate cyclase [Clostridia bacterium]